MGSMLKIRLQRVGRKNDASFRVVVTDSKRGVKSGGNVEILGSYSPRTNKAQIKSDRVKYWMSVGAGVSDTVHNLLIDNKIIEGKKVNVLPKKSPIVKEKSEEEEKKEEVKTKEKEDASPAEEAPKEEKVEEKPEEKVETETPNESPKVADAPKEEDKAVEEKKEEVKPEEVEKAEEPKEEEVKTEK